MSNNEEQNAIEQVKETKKMAEESAKLAANAASGNFIGATKNAFNLLKNKKIKKIIVRKLIKGAILVLIPIILSLCFFGILNTMKDSMIDLLSNASTAISGFLGEAWQWITDDYWIKLDEKVEYIIDSDTGETLGSKSNIKDEDLKTENGEEKDTITESYTIVDKYIKELGSKGISLKELRLLGDADYSDEENILKDEKNKALVEKYIAEFIRADIITQQPHKRRGTELVKEDNQNWVDGGVYFYRTKKEPTINEDDFENGNYNKENEEVTDKAYQQMEFMNYDEFMEKLSENDKNLRYRFTIDKVTGDMILAKIKTVTEASSNIEVGNGWFQDIINWVKGQPKKTTEYKLEEVHIPYKQYIAQYTMPYEFLINLCQITQNPEFVYHVALLARNTKIILVVQDNITITQETEEAYEEKISYKNSNGPSVDDAVVTETENVKSRTTRTTTEQTPVLRVEYADTWSFYNEFDFTKNMIGEKENTEVETNDDKPTGDVLTHVAAKTYIPSDSSDPYYKGEGISVTIPEYWEGTFTTKTEKSTQVITTTTTYNEPLIKKSVEKSKGFLGLLRNDTGKCSHDCFNENAWKGKTPTALECVNKSEFNRNGINVQYRIPNMTKMEAPLNKLLSGLDMLYALLQSNNSENINEHESAYIEKMQGLAEHMRYLMTFPVEEESYTIKDIILDTIFGNNEGGNHLGFGYGFWWPTNAENSPITSPFGMRVHPTTGINTMHKGIDIGIPIGTEVIATADGTVSFVGTNPDSLEGLWIKIDHGNGISSVYMHLSEIKVSVGQVVSQGEVIALSGNTGRSTGPHLHFGISTFGEYVDPLLYVSQANKKPEKVEVGENVEDWREYIETAFSELGYTMTEDKVTRILRQISRESSGIQNVIQGIKDSNSDTPITFNNGVCPWCPSLSGSSCKNTNIGHGLLQFIPTTFESCKLPGFGDIFNGYHQICALIVNAEEKGRGNYNHIGNGTGWGPY